MTDKLETIFEMQKQLQKRMFGFENIPVDSIEDFKYSLLAMIGEIGEVLDADRRWKNVRAKEVKSEEKLEEICDVLAFFINMCLFSGYDASDIYEAFCKKNKKNFDRLNQE